MQKSLEESVLVHVASENVWIKDRLSRITLDSSETARFSVSFLDTLTMYIWWELGSFMAIQYVEKFTYVSWWIFMFNCVSIKNWDSQSADQSKAESKAELRIDSDIFIDVLRKWIIFEIKHEMTITMHGSWITQGKHGVDINWGPPSRRLPFWISKTGHEKNKYGPSLYGWKEYILNLPKNMRL